MPFGVSNERPMRYRNDAIDKCEDMKVWRKLMSAMVAAAAASGCADLGDSSSSYDFTDEVRAPFGPFSRCVLRTLEDARYGPLQIGKEDVAHYPIERGMVIYQHDLHIEYFRVT